MNNSFSHPNMISSSSGGFLSKDDKTLVKQNLRLILSTTRTELYGDPYFGTNLKRLLFDPNDIVLKDLVIDNVFLAIRMYLKEITVARSDITITQHKQMLVCSIKFQYNKDGTNDLYRINLITNEEV